MYRIRRVSFVNHPVLNDLELDFCDINGNTVDTIIFAGENGTGKSTILNALYSLVTRHVDFEADIELKLDSVDNRTLHYYFKESNGHKLLYVNDGLGFNSLVNSPSFENKYPTSAIFSDIDINFTANQVSSVTSINLDENKSSRRSTNALPTQIKQLLIDIQALDDADIAYAVRTHPEMSVQQLDVSERMPRFTNSFSLMFDNLSFSRIVNENNHKLVVFTKNGADIPIDSLSSGEKQIVYRGCFLLKDVNALNGSFVFIDEPEISLHPKWQMKIMDYYQNIFTDKNGIQTSQIFAVTHSPFIIHNENRKRDKVIVLDRDDNGNIIVKDKPEYYRCDTIEAIKDAFDISAFISDEPTVYLEGRTDEKYFNKALEVFGINAPFRFKWIGVIDKHGNDFNTGDGALKNAVSFLVARNLSYKNVCLFDCDTHRAESYVNNVYVRTVPQYTNIKNINKGIENALVLDFVDISDFYTSTNKIGDYGENNTIGVFKKMELCDYICSLDPNELKTILSNLKHVIESLIELF